jgi:4,5-dihydroxyphthalate decarboxylase
MGTKLPLRLACWDYDRTRSLIDGRVQPEDIDLQVSVMRPREAFTRMLEREEFDVAEVSLANYTQLKAKGDMRFVGIPVALSRMFRHSCIYVRAGVGVAKPEDLIGRRIGAAQLDSTGLVFIKGMLWHDYGVRPDRVRWVTGGLEVPAKAKMPPTGHGAVETLGDGETLVSAFKAGKLDAIISNHIPSPFLAGDPQMLRLFADFKPAEQDYFQRTGLFPIMHIVAMRADMHAAHPDIATKLFAAFCAARDRGIADLYDTDALRVAVPWLIDAIDESRRVLGKDYWSYGAEQNRKVWDTLATFLVEQQLAARRPSLDEMFITG